MAHPLAGFSNPMTTRGDVIVEDSTLNPVRLALGANGTVLTSNGTDPAWAAAGASAVSAPIYGDGSHGAINLDGTNTYPGVFSTTGSAPNLVYTALQDVNATSFTLAAGKTCEGNGCVVYATVSITINGTFQRNGANASGATAGITSGPNGGLSLTSVGGGDGGANAVGTDGNASNSVAIGGNAGAGGRAAVNLGGAAGVGTNFAGNGTTRTLLCAMTGYSIQGAQPFSGGAGGGGGGADAASTGGGGGGGGGAVSLIAPSVTVGAAGVISAKGGNGAAGVGASAGGGGGGGGGVIWIVCQTHTNGGSETVAGGTGGALAGTGTVGAAGVAGLIVILTGH